MPENSHSSATGFLFETLTHDGTEYKYALYVPRDYDPDRPWPLIVFLNGSGECGTDGAKHLAIGLAPAIMFDQEAWPFLVLFPQKPDPARQWEEYDPAVMAMLDRARSEYHVDGSRIYLTGLSQGGHGTWAIGGLHAGLWAAIAPVCGYGSPSQLAPPLKTMPIWAFHGDADRAVPVKETEEMAAALEAEGNSIKVTIYPGVDHNSWDNAYRSENLADWLLSHRRER